jgi:selT/selW/selH-like putative selenoprotein
VAAAVEEETSHAVELVEGSGGVFVVRIDGKTVYSKQKTGRFPSAEEIVSIVRQPPAGWRVALSDRTA